MAKIQLGFSGKFIAKSSSKGIDPRSVRNEILLSLPSKEGAVILAELEFDTLAGVGVGEADLDELVEGALGDYFISVAPAPWSAAEVRAAYEQGLALGASR